MKTGYTKIVFLADRSASIITILDSIIRGYNGFISKQKELNVGECDVSLYQFNDSYRAVYENVKLKDIVEISKSDYVPCGGTALYDSLGKCIDNLGVNLSVLDEDDRPENVLVIVMTDGEENSSVVFSSEDIKEKIKHQTEVYNWQFSYIGANQDAWVSGGKMGFSSGSTMTYSADINGVCSAFNVLSSATTYYRSGGEYNLKSADNTPAHNGITNIPFV